MKGLSPETCNRICRDGLVAVALLTAALYSWLAWLTLGR